MPKQLGKHILALPWLVLGCCCCRCCPGLLNAQPLESRNHSRPPVQLTTPSHTRQGYGCFPGHRPVSRRSPVIQTPQRFATEECASFKLFLPEVQAPGTRQPLVFWSPHLWSSPRARFYWFLRHHPHSLSGTVLSTLCAACSQVAWWSLSCREMGSSHPRPSVVRSVSNPGLRQRAGHILKGRGE